MVCVRSHITATYFAYLCLFEHRCRHDMTWSRLKFYNICIICTRSIFISNCIFILIPIAYLRQRWDYTLSLRTFFRSDSAWVATALRFVKVTCATPLGCSQTVCATSIVRAIIVEDFGRVGLSFFSLDKLARFLLRFWLGYDLHLLL